MKNPTIKLLTALVVLVILAVIFIVARKKQPVSLPQQQTVSQTPSSQNSANAPTPKAQPTKQAVTPKPTSTTIPPASPKTIESIAVADQKCGQLAKSQYENLYGGKLESSSFRYNYASSSGNCYLTVTGQTREAYSSSVVGRIYFRSATKNTLLMECTDSTGTLYDSSKWACVDKKTGQNLSLAQYNGLVRSLLTE